MQHKEITLEFMFKALLNYNPTGQHFCAYSRKGYRTITPRKTIIFKVFK